jgi:hypothetical protein
MTPAEAINKLLHELPQLRWYEVRDFVRYLRWLEQRPQEERDAWVRLKPEEWSEPYGPDEPDYDEADIKPELNSGFVPPPSPEVTGTSGLRWSRIDAMPPIDGINYMLAQLPTPRQHQVLDFVRSLRWLEAKDQEERDAWLKFGPGEWAELYGPDDDEYTEADIKPELNP